jgi:hypothetical protein
MSFTGGRFLVRVSQIFVPIALQNLTFVPPANLFNCRTVVYDSVTGLDGFEPWLSKLESHIDLAMLTAIAKDIPPEWHGSETELLALLERLDRRRTRVRDMLLATRRLARKPFPNWIFANAANA